MEDDSTSTLEFSVTSEGENRLVSFTAMDEARNRTQGFAPQFGFRPQVLLGPDGSVLEVRGVDEMAKHLEGMWEEGTIDPDIYQLLARNLVPEAQMQTARAHWGWITEVWAGQQLECGRVVSRKDQVGGLFMGSRSPVELESELESCESGLCVVMEAWQTVPREALQTALAVPMAQLERRGPVARGGSYQRRVNVVVDPATLVPLYVSFIELTEVVWELPDGTTNTREVADWQEYTLKYAENEHTEAPPATVKPGDGGARRGLDQAPCSDVGGLDSGSAAAYAVVMGLGRTSLLACSVPQEVRLLPVFPPRAGATRRI